MPSLIVAVIINGGICPKMIIKADAAVDAGVMRGIERSDCVLSANGLKRYSSSVVAQGSQQIGLWNILAEF